MNYHSHPVEDIESCAGCGEQRVIGDDWLEDGECQQCRSEEQ